MGQSRLLFGIISLVLYIRTNEKPFPMSVIENMNGDVALDADNIKSHSQQDSNPVCSDGPPPLYRFCHHRSLKFLRKRRHWVLLAGKEARN